MRRSQVRPAEEDVPLTYRRLLGARLYVHCGVRFVVAVTIVVAGYFADRVLGIDLELGALSALALFIALYNLGPWILSRPHRDTDVAGARYESMVRLSLLAVVLDFLSLTVAIWLVGGCRSPFVAFYLLHVIVSVLLLSRRAALALTALAFALLVALVLGEWTGIARPRMPVGAIAFDGPLDGRFALTLVVVFGTLSGLTCFLLMGLTGLLRSGERRIHIANAELSRLSEQRRDFLHIAMHNLKAPLGAVTMFLQNMRNGLAGPVAEKQRDWLDRSLGRLGDLTEFLADMQTLSSLENSIITTTFIPVDLAKVVETVVDDYRDVAEVYGLEMKLEILRPVSRVVGQERLLREAVVNYVTNAMKYTPRGGHVLVRLLEDKPNVRIEVTDDGEGIAPEDKDRLFGDFVRLIKPGSKAASIKGTGLGLSIVRRVVLAHDGEFGVDNRKGGGSTFFLELPALIE